MTPVPLRVAVAGLGFGEKVHLPALRDCPATEPVALWHPRPERLEQACHTHQLPGHSDFRALLADPGVDALVIATPPGARLELARAALAAGKPLLLEKPVALEAAAIEELQRLALARNLAVAVDFEYRAVPLFQQLAALLERDVLGTPWLVKFDWLMGSRADGRRPWSWYSSAAAGGGVLGALGTHAFDILRGVLRRMHGDSADKLDLVELDALFIWSTMHGLAGVMNGQCIDKLGLKARLLKQAVGHAMCRMSIGLAGEP